MQDAPVECVRLFHARCQSFMNKYILGAKNVLGKVTNWVVRYEVQGRG